MRNFLLVIILLFSFFRLAAQEKELSFNSETINNYFAQPRAALHLHLNKTTFFTGEEIWYTAYSFDRETGLVTSDQKNINVALIDAAGNDIEKHLLVINEGTAYGSFMLRDTLAQGTYFVKTFTASMNSLVEDESYTQAVQIINPNKEYDSQTANQDFDIQLLPEGGHLVAGLENTCGIKILSTKGTGIPVENISLLDEKNNVIAANIKTNSLGMGKFVFRPKNKKRYRIMLRLDQSDISVNLPPVERKGIILNTTQNYNSGRLQIKLSTNNATLPALINKKFTAMVHKDGLSRSYDVQFEPGYNSIVFQIPHSKLYTGVNTITIFNQEGEALLERLIFNRKNIPNVQSIITKSAQRNDSFHYILQNRRLAKNTVSKVSISALPARSIANTNKGNIYASAYLAPFVKGYIEQPANYFNPNNPKRNYELDLLLLNQGWSKYAWKQMYNFKQSDSYYNDGPGLRLDGYIRTLDTTVTGAQILLYSKENEAMRIAQLTDGGSFTIDSLRIDSGSRFEFTAQDASGSTINANFFYTLSPKEKDRSNKFDVPLENPFSRSEYNLNIPYGLEGEQLEEVVVKAKRLKYEDYFKQYNGIAIEGNEKKRGSLRSYLVKFDYIQHYNENLRGFVFGKVVTIDIRGITAVIPPRIIVDGISYQPSVIVDRLNMEDIDEIYFYKPDLAKTHTFIIFTDKKWSQTQRTSKVFLAEDNGLLPKKEYYQPAYSYQSETFERFGTLQWYPSIYSDDDGLIRFSIYNPTQLDVNLFIEGVSEDGVPFAAVKRMDFEPNN